MIEIFFASSPRKKSSNSLLEMMILSFCLISPSPRYAGAYLHANENQKPFHYEQYPLNIRKSDFA